MITREKIAKLKELTEETTRISEVISESIRTAQDRYNNVIEKVEREGVIVEIPRKALWEEVFYMGLGCQAAGILRKHHPEVFEAYEEQEKAGNALKAFTVNELGVDFTRLRLSDYLMMTEGMFDLLWSERTGEKRRQGAGFLRRTLNKLSQYLP
jgi:hypothetical protein